ncbi:SDR family NAD(P)-dependent oxidoreductase [Paenibacillus sp. CF384]|uniref:SDR family NAD(P)-dependent oxidoreductase n=1 Tax=Paenibacillus sp. CF384 TaxID=1884382 RepID=UPI000898AFB1|nr:SDR family NAD(P)-dependent oxidoreductase [Paenibacillus sp. CF384]SDW24606.1 benzil reductase ((S)-benzoin forming) [Paenibacillus sp. CF384]
MNRGKSVAIVTGTSRGIGEAVALELLTDGYEVYGLSRSESSLLAGRDRFIPIPCDVADAEALEQTMNRLFQEITADTDINELLLINNAAMLEPLKPIEAISASEMALHMQTSLLAPMLLCGRFIHHTRSLTTLRRKTIINVTSGLAEYSAPSMSMYCSGKAALNMLTRCIADEQRDETNPVHVFAFDPGMTDTQMQTVARGRDKVDFPLQTFFQTSYEQGKLRSTADVAAELIRLLGESHQSGSVLRAFGNER